MLELLYNYSIDFEISDRQHRLPLHIACQYKSRECVFYLLQCGVNLNSVDIYGNTALHYVSIQLI